MLNKRIITSADVIKYDSIVRRVIYCQINFLNLIYVRKFGNNNELMQIGRIAVFELLSKDNAEDYKVLDHVVATVVYRAIIDYVRYFYKTRNRHFTSSEFISLNGFDAVSSDDVVNEYEGVEKVSKVLGLMAGDEDGYLISMRVIDCLSVKEITKKTGIKTDDFFSRIRLAKERIRDRYALFYSDTICWF